jgi:hypothetical protein
VGRFRALRLPYAAWVTEEMDALSETPSKHQFPGRKLGLFFNHMKYSVFSRQLFPTLQLQPSIQRMFLTSDRRHGVVCKEITRENVMKIIISASRCRRGSPRQRRRRLRRYTDLFGALTLTQQTRHPAS